MKKTVRQSTCYISLIFVFNDILFASSEYFPKDVGKCVRVCALCLWKETFLFLPAFIYYPRNVIVFQV
jgi:hypothetical protein